MRTINLRRFLSILLAIRLPLLFDKLFARRVGRTPFNAASPVYHNSELTRTHFLDPNLKNTVPKNKSISSCSARPKGPFKSMRTYALSVRELFRNRYRSYLQSLNESPLFFNIFLYGMCSTLKKIISWGAELESAHRCDLGRVETICFDSDSCTKSFFFRSQKYSTKKNWTEFLNKNIFFSESSICHVYWCACNGQLI